MARPSVLALEGSYTLRDAASLWTELRATWRQAAPGGKVVVDMTRVENVDGAAVAILVHACREAERDRVAIEISGATPEIDELFGIYSGAAAPWSVRPPIRTPDPLTGAGRATVELARAVWTQAAFGVRLAGAVVGVVRQPSSANWGDLPGLMERAGADAVPIVVVIDFLIGVVTAYESAIQLRRFGATLYVADLVGASVVRELGPLMTAIIVTGRTGAAFAAELGTMAVSEEVDALRTMRIDPMRFLVFPRVVALVCMVPLLTLVGDAFGMLGGVLLARWAIGITGAEYMNETKTIVFASDVFWGIAKSAAFALAIGLIACERGLSATGGAAGVGRRTTSAVVSILFSIILLDALFAPFFRGHYV